MASEAIMKQLAKVIIDELNELDAEGKGMTELKLKLTPDLLRELKRKEEPSLHTKETIKNAIVKHTDDDLVDV